MVPKSTSNFYDLKAYVQILLSKLELNLSEKALIDNRFSDAIEIHCEGKTIAKLGKVEFKLLKEFDIEQEVFYAEIEIENCQQLREKENLKFRDIPKIKPY